MQTRPRPTLALALRWLALVSLLVAGALRPAFAQLTLGGSSLSGGTVGGGFTVTDANVVVSDLERHTPAAGVRSVTEYLGGLRWHNAKTLSLFAVTRRGLSSRTWDTDGRAWSDWGHLGNPTGAPVQKIDQSGADPGWDTSLRLLPGGTSHTRDWVATFGFRRPGSSLQSPPAFTGMPQLDATTGTLLWEETFPHDGPGNELRTSGVPSSVSASQRDFNPQAGFSRLRWGYLFQHVFGNGLPRGYVKTNRFAGVSLPLFELRRHYDGAIEEWIDHGTPPGHTGVDVGSGSAVSVIHDYLSSDPELNRERRYLFVATDPAEDGYGDGVNGSAVYARVDDGSGENWSWVSLGSPPHVSIVYGAPCAVAYYTGLPAAGGKGRIVVYVAGRSESGAYELWQQYHDGTAWRGWTRIGTPPGLSGEKFKLTSGVVWYDGTPNAFSALRINLFGYSEELEGVVGKLVEYAWDGSWHFNPSRTAPDGQSIRTTSSAVIDEGSRDRLVVFGRTETGRIWEFAREVQSGSASERWTDLSFEPLLHVVK